jgi:hypothetical protein
MTRTVAQTQLPTTSKTAQMPAIARRGERTNIQFSPWSWRRAESRTAVKVAVAIATRISSVLCRCLLPVRAVG